MRDRKRHTISMKLHT